MSSSSSRIVTADAIPERHTCDFWGGGSIKERTFGSKCPGIVTILRTTNIVEIITGWYETFSNTGIRLVLGLDSPIRLGKNFPDFIPNTLMSSPLCFDLFPSHHASIKGSRSIPVNLSTTTMRFTSALAVLLASLPSAFAATRTFDFNVVNGVVAPDGHEREWEITSFSRITCQIVIYSAVLINDQYPAPLITANKGDRLVINTHNKLSDPRMRRSVSIVCKKFPFIIFPV